MVAGTRRKSSTGCPGDISLDLRLPYHPCRPCRVLQWAELSKPWRKAKTGSSRCGRKVCQTHIRAPGHTRNVCLAPTTAASTAARRPPAPRPQACASQSFTNVPTPTEWNLLADFLQTGTRCHGCCGSALGRLYTLATLAFTLASRLLRPAWAVGIIGIWHAHPRNARVGPSGFKGRAPGPEFKTSSLVRPGKSSLESRRTAGNVQSAEHEVLARHTATQGPMQGAEESRELRDASCSEPANVSLAELGAFIVMNPPFSVLNSMSRGMDPKVSRLPTRCRPAHKCARGITRRNMGSGSV